MYTYEMNRIRKFKIALAAANLTQADFAIKIGVSKQLVGQVLRNPKQSATVNKKIDLFIEQHLQELKEAFVK